MHISVPITCKCLPVSCQSKCCIYLVSTPSFPLPSAKLTQPVRRPIQLSPKVSIQPKPVITAVPLAHATASLQANTIIIQPLQTSVLPVVKPAPISIQPAPPPGQRLHCTTLHPHCITQHIVSHQYTVLV